MAVQAQFGGLAGCLPLYGGAGLADEQMKALLSSVAGNTNKAYQYNCVAAGVGSGGAQSELTCNGGAMAPLSRKRGREDDLEHYVTSSSAALLPIPGIANRIADSAATASTSGGPAAASPPSMVWELLWQQQGMEEVDAVVRGECERLRAVLEHARKRQCQAVALAAARLVRAKDAEVSAARRRSAELEERLRQAAAESQAWRGVARTNEAVASGLRAALDTLLLRGGGSPAAHFPAEEGFGDSGRGVAAAAADDAESCFLVEVEDAAAMASSSPVRKWKCRACSEGEASVLLLPCRHLCLCKACEPRVDACPVCLAAKSAAIHVAGAN